MTETIVIDTEIQKCVGEDGLSWDDTDRLGLAVACVWSCATERFDVYGAPDISLLRERINAADQVISFNGYKFDFPLIWEVPPTELHRSGAADLIKLERGDLLRKIWKAQYLDPARFNKRTHGGWGLDAVAQGTLKQGKIGHGAEAPKWFQAGQWWRVVTYCLHDVQLTRDLYLFAKRYGFVRNQDGRVVEVAVP